MKQLMRLAAVLALTIGSAGCMTMSVASQLEPGADLTRYHTWTWSAPDGVSTGDPRLDNNPFFVNTLQNSIDTGMSAHGFRPAEAGQPADVLVHYHASVTQRFQVDEPEPNCLGAPCKPTVVDYDQGTLVVDLVDRATGKLLWRGWARDCVNGMVDDQDRMTAEVRLAVARIMAMFPRAPL